MFLAFFCQGQSFKGGLLVLVWLRQRGGDTLEGSLEIDFATKALSFLEGVPDFEESSKGKVLLFEEKFFCAAIKETDKNQGPRALRRL